MHVQQEKIMKLPKRIPYEFIIATGLLTGSCTDHSLADTYDLADTANANARNALSRQVEIIDRLDRIERRLGIQ
jgi:hypothetical protein